MEPDALSLAPKFVAFSSGIAPAFALSDFVSSLSENSHGSRVRGGLLSVSRVFLSVFCSQWALVDLGTDSCPRLCQGAARKMGLWKMP